MADANGGREAPGGMLPRVAAVISICTSPFILTAICIALVVLRLHPSTAELLWWGAIGLVCGAAVPFLFVYRLWRRGHVGDMHLARREQRAGPFLAALASGAVGVGLLHLVRAPGELVALGAVYVVVGLALTVISLRWKISVHVAVYAACIVALALIGYPDALYALLGVPAVLWARVYRGRHTPAQGIAGALLGVAVTPLVYWGALALLAGA